jgi:hypothetical protein
MFPLLSDSSQASGLDGIIPENITEKFHPFLITFYERTTPTTSSNDSSSLPPLWSGRAHPTKDISHERSCSVHRIPSSDLIDSWHALRSAHAIRHWHRELPDIEFRHRANRALITFIEDRRSLRFQSLQARGLYKSHCPYVASKTEA